eukprot:3992213-Amphidinium_carterae.1
MLPVCPRFKRLQCSVRIVENLVGISDVIELLPRLLEQSSTATVKTVFGASAWFLAKKTHCYTSLFRTLDFSPSFGIPMEVVASVGAQPHPGSCLDGTGWKAFCRPQIQSDRLNFSFH